MNCRPASWFRRPFGPTLALALLSAAACTRDGAPPAGPDRQPLTAPSPTVSVAAPVPSSALSPVGASRPPSASPAASPGAAPSASPSPSPSPQQLVEVPEANHGTQPFPAAPLVPGAYDMAGLTVLASANDTVARGAIDGKPGTEWSARQGVEKAPGYVFDLGTAKLVGRLDVLPDASPDVKVFFNVELSDDGKQWRTVASGDAFGSNQRPAWGNASWSAEKARYVRFKPTSWGDSWVAVWEFRLAAGTGGATAP